MTDNQEELDEQGWSTSLFTQTTEEMARAVVAAAAAVRPRPSIVFSANNKSTNKTFQKLQRHLARVWKQGTYPREGNRKGFFNPEHLTSQKRQWTQLQEQMLERKHLKDPNCLFEHMVLIGLHPKTDSQAIEAALLRKRMLERELDGSERLRDVVRHQLRGSSPPTPEPQILFVYPPGKRLPMRQKDLLAFCFPGGLEPHLVERTPSLSELNEIVYGQDHLMRDDLSYAFLLKVADNATLYGVCIYVPEIVQQSPGIMAMNTDVHLTCPPLSRFFVTAYRCYCLLTKLPFFGLHFEVLNSIISQERLDRITEYVNEMTTNSYETTEVETLSEANGVIPPPTQKESSNFMQSNEDESVAGQNSNSNGDLSNSLPLVNGPEPATCELSRSDETSTVVEEEIPLVNGPEPATCELSRSDETSTVVEEEIIITQEVSQRNGEAHTHSYSEPYAEGTTEKKAITSGVSVQDESVEDTMSPTVGMRHERVESVDSISSIFESFNRSVNSEDDDGTEEASPSGQEYNPELEAVLAWAEGNNCPLRILCDYYKLPVPVRGSSVVFQPLEHLQPLKFTRPADVSPTLLGGRTIELKSCRTSLEIAEMQAALTASEEALSLSVWTIATVCRVLSLENVLALFAGVLLEKQLIVICPNLGVLSAVVLSTIPLIRPFQWQSLLLPILPNQMLDFLDAPVPFIVGVQNKSSAVRSKASSVILVNAHKDKVIMSSTPQLPRLRELISALEPYHSRLAAERDFARKHPVHVYNDAQAHAAEGFLAVLRSYLESLCGNLRSHTITNVQSNNDKVSLLLKESFVEDFQSKDHPFMKLFVDTQLFSVHTDAVLSFIESD